MRGLFSDPIVQIVLMGTLTGLIIFGVLFVNDLMTKRSSR